MLLIKGKNGATLTDNLCSDLSINDCNSLKILLKSVCMLDGFNSEESESFRGIRRAKQQER